MDNIEEQKRKSREYYLKNREKILARYHANKLTEEFKKKQAERYEKQRDFWSKYNAVYYFTHKLKIREKHRERKKKEAISVILNCPSCNIRIKEINLARHMTSERCHRWKNRNPNPRRSEIKVPKTRKPYAKRDKTRDLNKWSDYPTELDDIKITFD
jgi:hypothetical protein